jgi:hypothetical protein
MVPIEPMMADGESGSKYDSGRVKNLQAAQERHDAVFIFAEHVNASVPDRSY